MRDTTYMQNSRDFQPNLSSSEPMTASQQSHQPTNHWKVAFFALAGIFILSVCMMSVYVFADVQSGKQNGPLAPVTPQSPQSVACTMEAKICPDGTAVGRSGPDCEFAACPESSATVSPMTSEMKVYKSTHYPYQVSYPESFQYASRDAGNSQYDGYKEQAFFENISSDSSIKSFYTYVQKKGNEPGNFIFDQDPTGPYAIDNVEGYYAELPRGYGDGGSTEPPAPMLVFQFVKDGNLYKLIFVGISSLQDPTAQQVIKSFKFTK